MPFLKHMYAAKKTKLRLKGLGLGLLVLILSLGVFSYFGVSNALKPIGNSETVLSFVVEEGDYLSVVSDGLIEKGLIRNALVFELFAKYQNLTDFKIGVYYLNQGMSVQDILVALNDPTAAVPKDVIITIVPGDWAKGIAQKLADQVSTVSVEELLTLWNDETYIRSLMDEYSVLTEELFVDGVNVLLEGYLMPETYYMNPQASADSLTRRILNQTQKVYDENKAQFDASGLSVHDVFILASVVQFEAQTEEDMRLVAQVFLNRLEINMALQSSVTVCYALYEYDSWRDCENLENQQIDSRYNTYLYKGLPLGPITNPSKKSLLATLNPTDNDYLFFLADVYGDGKVYYAKTFAEHERNIEKYLR
jgi:UPF0755 protein